MILPLLFLGSSIALGVTIMRLVKIHWFLPEFIASSLISGTLVAIWLFLGAIISTGYSWGSWLGVCISFGIAIALWHAGKRRGTIRRPFFPNRNVRNTWILVTSVTMLLLGWLLVSHMLLEKNGAYFSGGSAWGDLGLHMSLVSRFAQQSSFTWDLPIYVDASLTYPFLIDFVSGLYLRWGLSPQISLLIPSALFLFSFIQLLFFTAYRMFRSAGAAAIATMLFFSGGSPGGITAFVNDWKASGMPLGDFLFAMKKEYAHLADLGLQFSNLVADYFLPQRGILIGIAVFMLVTLLWWRASQEHKQHSWRLLLLSACLIGLLPFAHVHTFFVLSGILLWFVAWQSWQSRSLSTPWTYALVISIALAAPQVTWQLLGNFSDSFSYWKLGWLTPENQSILIFWLRNLGLGIILLVTNFWYIGTLKHNRSFHFLYYGPLVALFVITNIYIFQPHQYDNMKFMVFSYLGLSLYAGAFLAHLFRRKMPYPLAATAILISLTLVGALSLLRETYTSWEFNVASDITTAKTIQAIIPPDARVLTSDQHNHFVTTLVGRPIVMGYRGWLWTYGINYTKTEKDIKEMYGGSERAAELFKKYNVSFVVIGPSEKATWKPNITYFDEVARPVLQTDVYSIYDVRNLAL